MKKVITFVVIALIAFLILHWVIWKIFGVGLPAFFPYKNRINQKCVYFSGDAYKPPWFNLIYKSDTTCLFPNVGN